MSIQRFRRLLVRKGLDEREFVVSKKRNRIDIKINKYLPFLPHDMLYAIRRESLEIGKPTLVSLRPYKHIKEEMMKRKQGKRYMWETKFNFPFLYGYDQKIIENSWQKVFTPRDLNAIMRYSKKHSFMNIWSSLREAVWKYHIANMIEEKKGNIRFYDNVLTKTRMVGKELKKNRWKTWFKKDLETDLDLLAVKNKKGYIIEVVNSNLNNIPQKAEVWSEIITTIKEGEGVKLIPWIFTKKDLKRIKKELSKRFPEYKVTKIDEIIKHRK